MDAFNRFHTNSHNSASCTPATANGGLIGVKALVSEAPKPLAGADEWSSRLGQEA